MGRTYEIHTGRRVVKTVLSSSPLQAAIDYVHTFGSAKEIPFSDLTRSRGGERASSASPSPHRSSDP